MLQRQGEERDTLGDTVDLQSRLSELTSGRIQEQRKSHPRAGDPNDGCLVLQKCQWSLIALQGRPYLVPSS